MRSTSTALLPKESWSLHEGVYHQIRSCVLCAECRLFKIVSALLCSVQASQLAKQAGIDSVTENKLIMQVSVIRVRSCFWCILSVLNFIWDFSVARTWFLFSWSYLRAVSLFGDSGYHILLQTPSHWSNTGPLNGVQFIFKVPSQFKSVLHVQICTPTSIPGTQITPCALIEIGEANYRGLTT